MLRHRQRQIRVEDVVGEQPTVTDFASVSRADTARYGKFFHGMLKRGIYLAPSQFEAAFVSTAHGEAEIGVTLEAAAATLNDMA